MCSNLPGKLPFTVSSAQAAPVGLHFRLEVGNVCLCVLQMFARRVAVVRDKDWNDDTLERLIQRSFARKKFD